MPLLGSAAMLLTFDVVADAVEEHDRWHTHEHLPERLSIPGFRRGTRWIATEGGPRYMVLYEVERLATLASEPYLAAPRRFVWNPTVRINGRRRARWACGQAAFEPVHMSTGRLPGARF